MFLAKAFQTDTRPRLEASTLTKTGYRIYVLAWDRYSQFRRIETLDGVEVRSFNRANLRKFSRLGLSLGAMLFQVLLLLKTVRLIALMGQRPIIHAHDFNTLLPGCLLRILRLSSTLIYDCHELSYAVYSEWFSPIIGSIVRIMEESFIRHTDAIITVSDPIGDYLSRSNRPTTLIYNYPSVADAPRIPKHEIRVRLGLPHDAFVVSYVGEIRYGCRLDLVLAAASRARDEDLHFVFVGGGPLASEFGQAARKLCDPRLTVLPQMPRERALLYVAASDLTWVVYDNLAVSLSERLAMPWKFFESLACGVPVIVDKNTLAAKLTNELSCGVVLESLAPSCISQTIVSLAKDTDRHQKMCAAAKNAATGLELNWESMSRRLIDVYGSLARC